MGGQTNSSEHRTNQKHATHIVLRRTCIEENYVRWPVSRVLFSLAREMAIPLGRSLPNASRDLPGQRPETAIAVPIWSCSRWGLPCHLRYRRRGALLPHHFNLARIEIRRRSIFCCAFPGVASAGRYPAPCFRGARTFLSVSPEGLRGAATRPSDVTGMWLRSAECQISCKRAARMASHSGS